LMGSFPNKLIITPAMSGMIDENYRFWALDLRYLLAWGYPPSPPDPCRVEGSLAGGWPYCVFPRTGPMGKTDECEQNPARPEVASANEISTAAVGGQSQIIVANPSGTEAVVSATSEFPGGSSPHSRPCTGPNGTDASQAYYERLVHKWEHPCRDRPVWPFAYWDGLPKPE
jgi:hypothetical protein